MYTNGLYSRVGLRRNGDDSAGMPISLPSGAPHLDIQTDSRMFERLNSCAGRSLAFASSRLGEYRYLSDPTQTSGKAEFCDLVKSRRIPFTFQ